MKYTVQYPLAQAGYSEAFMEPANVTRFAVTAEEAGFSAIAFTEHPAPSEKWMRGGGHESFDPFVALSFCAAVTTRIRLMTYLLVLPYRNPLMAAKCAASLDVLSGGRVTLGVGVGYLRSEFAALGVDFDERNLLFDEALETMKGIWATDAYSRTGLHFEAIAQTADPKPVQDPAPPFWIGGNSRTARRRVASEGSGWSPLLNDATRAGTTRTSIMATPSDLRRAVDDLHQLVSDANRDPKLIDVQVETTEPIIPGANDSLARHVDAVGSLGEAGATWLVVDTPAHDVEAALDAMRRYGEDVIAQSK